MPVFGASESALHYLSRGRGEPVLLIHGLGSCGRDWALQVPALEKRFQTIVPDLPGCGHSKPWRDRYSIQGFAKSLWALLDHLEIAAPNIVGFSLGGAVGLEMALQRPTSVPRLALINSLASYVLDDRYKWFEARFRRRSSSSAECASRRELPRHACFQSLGKARCASAHAP